MSNQGWLESASPTPPSDVFPIAGRDTSNFTALEAPGARHKTVGGWPVFVIELRGWIREHATSCNDAASELRGTGPDWSYQLELDPAWTDSLGAGLNQIFQVGSITEEAVDIVKDHSPTARVALPTAKVELASWRQGSPVHAGRTKPADWVFRNDCRADIGDTYWPFNPARPLSWLPKIAKDQYVRVVGSLITDTGHESDYNLKWGATDAVHTEIHSPDLIEVLPDRPRSELVQAVAVYADAGNWRNRFIGQLTTLDHDIQLPEPPSCAAGVDVQELIMPGTNLNTIVEGNDTKTGARITIDMAGRLVHLKVGVRGEDWGRPPQWFQPRPGKFSAIYRVRFTGAPPALHIAPSDAWIPAGESRQFTVAPAVPVSWQVKDSDSSIDPTSGLFHAPDEVDPNRYVVIGATEVVASPNDLPRTALTRAQLAQPPDQSENLGPPPT